MPGKEPSSLSEEQARRLWERAAELQADAARSQERREGEEKGRTRSEEADSGYSLVHVRQAALEAGIQGEFLDLALAEEALLELEGGAQERFIDRAARRVPGRPPDALEIQRTFAFPAARVWPVLERVATCEPTGLELLEVRGGDPRSGGVALFEAPYDYQNLGSLRYAASFSDVRRFLIRVVPGDDPATCVALIRAPLRRSRRVHFVVSTVLSGGGGVLGGLAGVGLTGLLVGSGGMAVVPLATLVLGLSGGGAVGGSVLTRMGCNSLHRWGLRMLERAIQKVLSRVERELQREEEEKSALLPPGEPPQEQAG